MSRRRAPLTSFGLPAVVLGFVLIGGWVATAIGDPTLGPMILVPFRPTPNGEGSPPETRLEALSPLAAEIRNALIPFSRRGGLTAVRYQTGLDAEPLDRAVACLTSAIYYEAGQEPLAGKRAVAQVIINRWGNSAFPKTICGVVQQGAPRPGCQFTFMCDGSLSRAPAPAVWAAAQVVARGALEGDVFDEVGGATHYHADYVLPVWASTMPKIAKIGRHIFYMWMGGRILSRASPPAVAGGAEVVETPGAAVPNESKPLNTTSAAPSSREPAPDPGPSAPAAPQPTGSPETAGDPVRPPLSDLDSPRPVQPPRRPTPERSLRSGPF